MVRLADQGRGHSGLFRAAGLRFLLLDVLLDLREQDEVNRVALLPLDFTDRGDAEGFVAENVDGNHVGDSSSDRLEQLLCEFDFFLIHLVAPI